MTIEAQISKTIIQWYTDLGSEQHGRETLTVVSLEDVDELIELVCDNIPDRGLE